MALSVMTSGGATCRLSLPPQLEAVRETVKLACAFISDQRVGEQDLVACELALVEACNNAVSYSIQNPPSDSTKEMPIDLEVRCDSHWIEMHVIDQGPGFEWPEELALPDPAEEHGRGLYIIQSLMDDVAYLSGRGQNRLIMRLSRGSGGEPAASMGGSSDCTPQYTDSTSPRGNSTNSDSEKTSRHGAPRSEGSAPTEAPKRLAEVEQKLALSEHVIGTMAKEICCRSEELAAIFRSTSELGGGNDIEAFSERLLNDLLHLSCADWFIFRLTPAQERKLVAASASHPAVSLPAIDLDDEEATHFLESKAALARRDVSFGNGRPMSASDPLFTAHPHSAGLVKPIYMGGTLLGTLAIGRNPTQPAFTPYQLDAINTFCEFLAIQSMNVRLHHEHLDHRLTSRELDIARNIQQSLLPKRFPKLEGYGLGGFCINARQVGGDFFDVLPLTEDKTLLVIADVMGKGVPAALFAATLHTLIRSVSEWTHRPIEIMERVNRLIYDELSGVDMFITAQIVLADIHKRRLVIANAGHCPVLIQQRDGSVEAISPEGMPLGIMPDSSFEHRVVSLADCSAAILYTDGLTEARNAHGEFFGQERFVSWLTQHHAANPTASELSESLKSEIKSFQGQTALSDDQTFLVLAEQPFQHLPMPEVSEAATTLFELKPGSSSTK